MFSLCRAERAAGADVRVVTTTANGESDLDGTSLNAAPFHGIPVRYCARAWPRSLFYAPALHDVLASELRDADVLHIHGLWNATVWTAASIARRLGKPYVLSPRGMLASAALSHNSWRKRLVFPITDRRVVERASRLHATSKPEFDDLNEMPLRGRAVLIPNGVNILPLAAASGAIRRRFHLPDVAPLVLFLGRIHPIKRLDLLAAAFANVLVNHPSAHLVIAGPDEQGHRATLEPFFAGMVGSVTWTGPVADAEKQQLLEAAAALVMCSNSESFGMSAAEAMAAGTPVVVTQTCPWQEVEQHRAGYWIEQTPDAIADAINALLADPATAKDMGTNGRALMAARYTWRQAAAALIHEYESIAR